MDYDTVELLVASVLVLVPIVTISAMGTWCLAKGERRLPWFFFLAPLGSVLFAWLAGGLALKLFPPPYDEHFAGGRGLDLRGMIIVLGAMLGGFAGIVTSVVLCTVNLVRQYLQRPRAARPNPGR